MYGINVIKPEFQNFPLLIFLAFETNFPPAFLEVTCECGFGYVGDGEFCNGNLASVLATHSNFSVFYSVSNINIILISL